MGGRKTTAFLIPEWFMKRLVNLLIVIILLSSCVPLSGPASSQANTPPVPSQPSIQPSWWNKAVFYEIFVRSYYDSNGDGIGDFNGITMKLDYLKNLGINAIWLMPIHPSPTYHGYDVIDYYDVNSQYGAINDFKQLLTEAHKRGIRIILDLVLNHTSNQNPWFVDANNDPQSPYRDWYIWSATDPGYPGPVGTAWHPGKFGYYYGIFSDSMPDLNYKNPAVTQEMEKVVSFWLKDIGVDGFRLDAVKYLIEDRQKQENTSQTHDWLKGFYSSYKTDNPQAYTVGEVYGADAALAKTYTGNQLDQVFEFELASGFVNSANGQANSGVISALTFVQQDMPNGQFATFLTNHDQNRVMSVLNGNISKAKVAAAMLLTAPGTPFIYYGEEIGMQGEKPDEDIRLPMQWSTDANAGFTTGTPWRTPATSYPLFNVATESKDPNSLLSFYRNMIAIRSKNPALQYGSLALVSTGNPGVYAILRGFETENILVLINLTKSSVGNYNLSIQGTKIPDGKYHLTAVLGEETTSTLNIRKSNFDGFKPIQELPPYSILVYKIKP